jgi:hypothetical protein
MKRIALLLSLIALPVLARAASTIDNTNAFAWGANIGWTNWHGSDVGQPPGVNGMVIGEYICQGWIYGANVGWISVCRKDPTTFVDIGPTNNIQYSNTGSDYGVNYIIDPAQPGIAFLRGLAYGANIGWINFDDPGFPFPVGALKPQLSLFTGKLKGYAYSANCGWISLDEFDLGAVERFVETDHVAMGADTDTDGIADAFEFLYAGNLALMNGTSDKDKDGFLDIDEYRDGTNPSQVTDRLRVTAFSTNTAGTSSPITFSSTTGRLYIVETKALLTDLSWSLDPTFGTAFAPDPGILTSKTLTAATASKRFYRVRSVRPLP